MQKLALEAIDRVEGESPGEPAVLTGRAALLMRLGRREAAAAAYAKLAKLEPEHAEHGLRLAQLGPETIAAWHFDFDAEAWRPHLESELTFSGGLLQLRNTKGVPRIRAAVSAPPGCYEMALRLRAKNSALGSLVWTTTAQEAPAASRAGYRQLGVSIRPAGATWQTIKLYFCPDAELTGLFIGFGQGNESLELDALSLRRVDAQTAFKELDEAIRQVQANGQLRVNHVFLHGTLERWAPALAELSDMKRRNPGAAWRPFYHLLLLAQTGDDEGYRAERRDALERLAKNEQAGLVLIDLTARAALLRPAEGDDLKLAGELLDRVLKDKDTARLRWRQLTKGLAEYRRGQFQSAIDWAEKSRQGPPETPADHLEAQGLLVLAIAHHRLGQTDRCAELLAPAAKFTVEKLPKPGSGPLGETWPDWIISHALYREAARLIAAAPRREPVEAPPTRKAN